MPDRKVKSSKYHVTWTPKYRKPFLTGKILASVKFSLFQKAKELGIQIVKLEIMPEHIHAFLDIPITLSISNVVKSLKGYSSYYTRKNLNLYKYKSFWSKGYFCESVGHISESTVKRYIDNQWKHYKPNSSPD